MQDVDDHVFNLKKLFGLHRERVFQIAYRMTLSTADADDIVQEVFLKLFRSMHRNNRSCTDPAWIYRITVNASLDHLRQRKRWWVSAREPILPDQLPGHAVPIEFDSDKLSKQLQLALSTLKPSFRAVVILRDLEGFSYEEIADIMGIGIGTVSSRLHRAYQLLRKKLGQFDIDNIYRGDHQP